MVPTQDADHPVQQAPELCRAMSFGIKEFAHSSLTSQESEWVLEKVDTNLESSEKWEAYLPQSVSLH
jgi:hypothetical protein